MMLHPTWETTGLVPKLFSSTSLASRDLECYGDANLVIKEHFSSPSRGIILFKLVPQLGGGQGLAKVNKINIQEQSKCNLSWKAWKVTEDGEEHESKGCLLREKCGASFFGERE